MIQQNSFQDTVRSLQDTALLPPLPPCPPSPSSASARPATRRPTPSRPAPFDAPSLPRVRLRIRPPRSSCTCTGGGGGRRGGRPINTRASTRENNETAARRERSLPSTACHLCRYRVDTTPPSIKFDRSAPRNLVEQFNLKIPFLSERETG